ncbi:hypothetical protein MDS_2231 [Ectopseudomonas mendocina NK-01]|nr:hypothetical protein MDS_2231 [Pseudomonas mendocina NK-01]
MGNTAALARSKAQAYRRSASAAKRVSAAEQPHEQFKQAYVFSLTAPELPHNLAKHSTYRDRYGRGQHLSDSTWPGLIRCRRL